MKTVYAAGMLTGALRTDGTTEIGNTCGHEHRSREAAAACANKQRGPERWMPCRLRDDRTWQPC